jgi:hypothetical protein
MNCRMGKISAACRPHLARSAAVAVIVGTVLCAINQIDVLLADRATGSTWLKVALTYLVPFLVSNYGILSATRSTAPHGSLSSNRRVITRIGGSHAAGRGVRPPSSRLSRIPGQETRSGRWRALGLSVVQSLGGAGRRIWV